MKMKISMMCTVLTVVVMSSAFASGDWIDSEEDIRRWYSNCSNTCQTIASPSNPQLGQTGYQGHTGSGTPLIENLCNQYCVSMRIVIEDAYDFLCGSDGGQCAPPVKGVAAPAMPAPEILY